MVDVTPVVVLGVLDSVVFSVLVAASVTILATAVVISGVRICLLLWTCLCCL